ncbi:MAG TPA: DNA-processing protein DprA [Saprospiraceae bacterium]|nr:DNA-processing protein DprA [Saprospiraceae bacterium]MCC6689632.1 DNA-protecting protein DprA [Saprospiraceae bacterium]HMX82456.1 DNA-processing protein DprA [Saprospiraceae bacterium]HMX84721.1 DNA-processing protein DprA [Saprospiraceae bacterium]HMZ72534.1 DNA-processing protein DprA [Saprospiraceae bacterium]
MNQEELFYRIAITMLPKVGPVTARNLISYCGGTREVFETSTKALMKIPGVGAAMSKSILQHDSFAPAEQELAFIDKQNIKPIFYLDDDYPKRLQNVYDAPVLLYFRGDATLNAARTVGIVGTRTPTPHGIANCEALVEGLAKYNVQIISGLAHGIDGTSHRAAVAAGISNIGVVAHGLDHIYPAAHSHLANSMIKNGGVLTEFPSNTTADKERFPMRNRIIAAMSDALVVVETARKGGSMITADMAFNYNKDIFAFPGRTQDKYSQGCNYLIKSQKAGLIENAEDLAAQMMWDKIDSGKTVQTSMFVELSELERKVLSELQTKDTGIDELSYIIQLTPAEMASVLLEMEFKGLIKSIPGKRYILA